MPTDGIHVSYGHAAPDAGTPVVRGGLVKLLHLQEAFPDAGSAFNLLYLVSSAQPPFAGELARWAKARGIKVVWNQDGVAYPAWADRGWAALNATMRVALQHADYVIYQSQFCRDSAARFLGPVAAPSEVLPNCVDTSRFHPPEMPVPDAPWTLLAAGSHEQRDRVLRALETLAELRRRGQPVRLIIAGPLRWPDSAADVRQTIDRLGIGPEVELVPPYSQATAPELFRRTHVLLHLKYKDPCPTVVLEALASGVPVVGSRSGGLPELLDDDGGILLDVPDSWERLHVPDASATADAVTALMRDLPRRRQMARRRAERHFARGPWIERHAAVFGRLLRQG